MESGDNGQNNSYRSGKADERDATVYPVRATAADTPNWDSGENVIQMDLLHQSGKDACLYPGDGHKKDRLKTQTVKGKQTQACQIRKDSDYYNI